MVTTIELKAGVDALKKNCFTTYMPLLVTKMILGEAYHVLNMMLIFLMVVIHTRIMNIIKLTPVSTYKVSFYLFIY